VPITGNFNQLMGGKANLPALINGGLLANGSASTPLAIA
jgi:hypothetical protein